MEEKFKEKKKLYQRWWVWIIAAAVILFAWMQISRAVEERKQESVKLVPNVMSIDHTDAKQILEKAEFEVEEIETSAESVLKNDLIYNRSVKKGEVFKVNEETDPNYSDYSGDPIAEDGKVIIYYAKDDYIYVENTPMPISGQNAANDVTEEKDNTNSSEAVAETSDNESDVKGGKDNVNSTDEKTSDNNSKYLIDGKIKIKLGNDIPQTIYQYSDINGEVVRSHDITKVYVKGNGIYVDGTKRSDIFGNEFGCKILWKLYNESGAVVKSDWVLSPAIDIGEGYSGESIRFVLNSLEPGEYTLQFCDDK